MRLSVFENDGTFGDSDADELLRISQAIQSGSQYGAPAPSHSDVDELLAISRAIRNGTQYGAPAQAAPAAQKPAANAPPKPPPSSGSLYLLIGVAALALLLTRR